MNLGTENSIISTLVAHLRDVNLQKNRNEFRTHLTRIGEIMAYEISKKLVYTQRRVITPLGAAECAVLSQQPVIATILRAGLPLHQGLLNIFLEAQTAFVSAYRKHAADGSFEIKLEYVACPDISNQVLIIADPMLASGESLSATLTELLKFGKPKEVHLVCAIASQKGVEKVQKDWPDATIWAAAVDPILDSKSYIVPGLGDAGDLAFGQKLQH